MRILLSSRKVGPRPFIGFEQINILRSEPGRILGRYDLDLLDMIFVA
jgi:hypothetical protein